MTRSTYEKRERNERHPREGGEGKKETKREGRRGGIKGMDGWKCGIHLCIRGRNFEHSIVCFRKIRDGTAKASRAQFTLLNRRNGFEHRLFPRCSAFKFSFRAVLLSFSSLSFFVPLQSIFNSRVRVHQYLLTCPLRFTDFHVADPDRIPPHKVTPISSPIASRESSGIRNYNRVLEESCKRKMNIHCSDLARNIVENVEM